jgi:hypothetical protein
MRPSELRQSDRQTQDFDSNSHKSERKTGSSELWRILSKRQE